MARLTRDAASNVFKWCSINPDTDFHALTSEEVYRLLNAARLRKYRKPKNANGSTARYFHAYCIRTLRT